MRSVTLDMDGTIADLYGVPHWLDSLRREDSSPYRDARPLCGELDRIISRLQSAGVRVEVVSWLSKGTPSEVFDRDVRRAKLEWLRRNVPSIDPQDVRVVRHGTDKYETSSGKDVLIDDERGNCETWRSHGGTAYQVASGDDVAAALRQVLETCGKAF